MADLPASMGDLLWRGLQPAEHILERRSGIRMTVDRLPCPNAVTVHLRDTIV